MQFAIENKTGKLLEARVFQLPDAAAVATYAAALQEAARPIRDLGPVLLADHRPVLIYSPEVADGLTGLFRGFNSVITRAALVAAPSNATLIMQLGRLVREASNPFRRLFTNPDDAAAFLHPALTHEERTRAASFLASR